jgi:hypothetical protein
MDCFENKKSKLDKVNIKNDIKCLRKFMKIPNNELKEL